MSWLGQALRKSPVRIFFGPRLPAQARVEISDLDPDKSIFRARFGDLGLINGEWRILGKVPNWTRSRWPIPNLVIRDSRGPGRHTVLSYSDTDPMRIEAEYPTDDDRGLLKNSLYGCGAIEITLNRLMRSNAGSQ